MASPPTLRLLLYLLLVLAFSDLIASQKGTCDDYEYGRPVDSDCTNLFEKFIRPQTLTTRLFAEEQLRADGDRSWPGIENPFNTPVIQLPKYYSLSESCTLKEDPRRIIVTLTVTE